MNKQATALSSLSNEFNLDAMVLNKPELADSFRDLLLQADSASPEVMQSIHAALRRINRLAKQGDSFRIGTVGTNGDLVSRNSEIRTLITEADGIFIGREEISKVGTTGKIRIPDVPEKFGEKFLESKHPLRAGIIASHVILAFSTRANEWICIDRGLGGRSDIIPDSLGTDGAGLSWDNQNRILYKIKVKGCSLVGPSDSMVVDEVIKLARALHSSDQKPVATLPFEGIFVRTADTMNGEAGCPMVLGYKVGTDGKRLGDMKGGTPHPNTGLIGVWTHH